MSEHDIKTIIENKDETIRRLVAERDDWKMKAERYRQELAKQMNSIREILDIIEQRGGL